MSKSRLLQEMDSREIAEWIAYFKIESQNEKKQASSEELKAKFNSLAPVNKSGGTADNKKRKR